MKLTSLCLLSVLAWTASPVADGAEEKPSASGARGAEALNESAPAAGSRLAANLKAGQPQTIVTCGTSLTAGDVWVKPFRAALDQSFPGLATIVNTAVSGSYSQWLVDHLDEAVIRRNPDAVFIEYGINDSVARFHYSRDHGGQSGAGDGARRLSLVA